MIPQLVSGAVLLLLVSIAGAIPASAAPENLLSNPAFADGAKGWSAYPAGLEIVTDAEAGVASITVGEDRKADDWYQVNQRFDVKPGQRLALRVETRGRNTRDGQGVVVSLAFHDAQGKRLAFADSYQKPPMRGWMPAVCRATVPEGAAYGSAVLILHGRGEASFRNPSVRHAGGIPSQTPEGTATITVTDTVVCPALVGFGAEDDGWSYSPRNREKGADEAGFKLREKRIAWMQPDWVRMFFWYNDWNPSLDGKTYTWDTPGMESHYRSLALYERLGTQVTVAGVEWAVRDPWRDPETLARAVGDLLEHLTVTKGFTCVKYWTLSNEPNLFFIQQDGASWEKFIRIHTLVKAEIDRRGLDIKIMGSDDGDGLPWFTACVKDDTYFGLSDAFASHIYFPEESLDFLPEIFADHLGLLATRKPYKPYVIAEFGFRDERFEPPATNPFMEDYPYALRTQATCITGLNEGVAGFNIWCMHEVYYPGGATPMGFGLWNFADRDWGIRPVYHSMANFMRHTKAGDTVFRCESAHPAYVRAARAGDTLFWVNLHDQPVEVTLAGFDAKSVRIHTEDTLAGDAECGTLVESPGNAFTAPPLSFGYALAR